MIAIKVVDYGTKRRPDEA